MPRSAHRTARAAPLTARTADKHDLYQRSVQAVDHEVVFFDKIYKRHTGRKATLMREDFCGTALLCAEWVKSNKERRAVGLDIDPSVLAWGTRHNLAPLGRDAERVRLLAQDVAAPTREKFEIICAYNYSYSVFQTRRALLDYFRAVHRSLRDDGLFSIDAIGGWEAQQELVERRALDGFTYVWEQAEYDPVTAHFVCHISFELPDKTVMKRAFTYDWRLWGLRELRDVMEEAGFEEIDAYWEGEDDKGQGTGEFHRVAKPVDNDPGWNAYLVAMKKKRR